jgi:hypothetical protein
VIEIIKEIFNSNDKTEFIKNSQRRTHGIANKGISGFRGFQSRSNFCHDRYERSPQTLTGHTANVAAKLKKKTTTANWFLSNAF